MGHRSTGEPPRARPSSHQRPEAEAPTRAPIPRRPNRLVPSSAPRLREQPGWWWSEADLHKAAGAGAGAARLRILSRRSGCRELLRRALSPPIRRGSSPSTPPIGIQRRWNFRHTPSRLSNMSLDH